MDGQYVEEQWEKVFLFGAFKERNKKRNQAANIFFICGQAYSVGEEGGDETKTKKNGYMQTI